MNLFSATDKPDWVLDRINNFKTCSVLKHLQFCLSAMNFRLPTCHLKWKTSLTFFNSVNESFFSSFFSFFVVLAHLSCGYYFIRTWILSSSCYSLRIKRYTQWQPPIHCHHTDGTFAWLFNLIPTSHQAATCN